MMLFDTTRQLLRATLHSSRCARGLAAAILLCPALVLTACSLELGEAPFLCNSGSPKCPDGYECMSNYCVKEGTCPEIVPECAGGNEECGDGTCGEGEDAASCPQDCASQPSCGDGTCDEGEDTASCPEDCFEGPTCGNDVCETGEDKTSCPDDCAEPTSCGDGTCDSSETPTSCPQDCEEPTSCGDGTCDPGETPTSCPADCEEPPSCGDGSCDPGETSTTCPADCGLCSDGQTECAGTESLKSCDSGVWQTETCESICLNESFDYSVGCEYSSTYNKDVCMCGYDAEFGDRCNDDLKCKQGLFCAYFPDSTDGYCTKYCSNPGGACTGAPAYTEARCEIQVGGQDACVFDCSDFWSECPDDLTCDMFSLFCQP